MANTSRYRQLVRRVAELRRHMLPAKFTSTGIYSDRVQDRARGYRLLVHAELEAYLEDMAKSVVTAQISKWKRHRTPSNLLFAFIACYHSGWIEYDEKSQVRLIEMARSRRKIAEKIEEIVDLAQQQFIQRLKENHGVREKNLRTLILPTGIDLSELDPTWITDLDDFGRKRGDLAHLSKSTTGAINPQDEYNRIKALLRGMKELDDKLAPMV